ncbi:proteinase-activated receptor 1-like [Rana temporaria]|uniref:proteinase-activated receptor 1-like n=1 Tax=Rana temporaria TaxID=8407 RepID=UPI001AAD55AC|nr:proteinase-activated receptor 1-like [Rana temporaria]
MGTNILLPLFFLTAISLWRVDCNNDTSDARIDDKNNRTSISDEVLVYLRSPWLTKFIPLVLTVVFVLSLPLNITAIVIFLFRIQVKTPAVVFMLNLAVVDVFLVILLPFEIIYRFSGNNWVIGEGMCRFVTVAFYCNMHCSIWLVTGISVDRFLAVVYPMRSLLWRTVSRAWQVCLLIWMVSIAGAVPLPISKLTFHIDQLNITVCYDTLGHKDFEGFYFYYFAAYISISFILPLIITTLCYAATIRSLSSPKIESTFKKCRSVFLCVTVLFEFIICFGPINIFFLLHYLNMDKPFGDTMYFAYIISVTVSSISCCLDPVIYYFGSSKCMKYIYSLVCCGKTKADHKQTDSSSKKQVGRRLPLLCRAGI